MYRNQTFIYISVKICTYRLQGGPETQKFSVHKINFGNKIKIFR